MANCGGNWSNGSTAGVFNVNLNNPRSNVNWNIGFRSTLKPEFAILRNSEQCVENKGVCFHSGRRKIYLA